MFLNWHIKEDFRYYKAKTCGKIVLMGENTYYSLKDYYQNKPLPYADYLFISYIKGRFLGDTYFPDFNIDLFRLCWKEETAQVCYTIFERI